MSTFQLNNQAYTVEALEALLESKQKVELGNDAIEKIAACRRYLDEKVSTTDELIYGVNTGFGSLCNEAISVDDLQKLQVNLVRSHACGTGNTVPLSIVKKMLLLKAIGLSFGHSGVQVGTVERLLFFYNNDILPVVYEQGSLGASGDLAPLAHVALALIGEGEVWHQEEKHPTKVVLEKYGLTPIELRSKEGLALLNGTQFMSAYLLKAVIEGKDLLRKFNLIGAMSLEAYDGRLNPFIASVNEVRNQVGQIAVAQEMHAILSQSELVQQPKEHVQDPYSFRCIPQVHGASLDAIRYAEEIVTREINAVTDNPTIFPEEDLVVSAGNFHGQPLAITMDFLAIALAELGSISERRIYKLMGGQRKLPAFLVANPGLNSGFMIAQYTAASIVSQSKQYCTPASVDTIDSSNGQEDHVSMGANAATKLIKVLENTWQIAGIELMTAAQGLQFRNEQKTAPAILALHQAIRKRIPFIENDTYMSEFLKAAKALIRAYKLEKK
jgi:histidine ammonia-lyase